jgi:photosynthetic reaction center H subunit
MQTTGAITGYIDVAQIALYVFWLFFFGLVIYLRKEDKREGYPLVGEQPGELAVGWPLLPKPKSFLLPNGDVVYAPGERPPQPDFNGVPADPWFGSALVPTGNPLLSGVGPNASALRSDTPDTLTDGKTIRIVPMRTRPDYVVDEDGPDPRGMSVIAADGVVVGTVSDMWFDIAEDLIRYLEVNLTAGGTILVPSPLTNVVGDTINVVSILGAQFADAPRTASPDIVTSREEDRISAYFASGHLFASPARSEPLI